jgi:hypothetical protein
MQHLGAALDPLPNTIREDPTNPHVTPGVGSVDELVVIPRQYDDKFDKYSHVPHEELGDK